MHGMTPNHTYVVFAYPRNVGSTPSSNMEVSLMGHASALHGINFKTSFLCHFRYFSKIFSLECYFLRDLGCFQVRSYLIIFLY